jgi:hypothetical protein
MMTPAPQMEGQLSPEILAAYVRHYRTLAPGTQATFAAPGTSLGRDLATVDHGFYLRPTVGTYRFAYRPKSWASSGGRIPAD